jgi:hypothetical protein
MLHCRHHLLNLTTRKISDLPKTDDEAFRRVREETKHVAFGEDWTITPNEGLDERLKRTPVELLPTYYRNREREGWHSDRETGVVRMDDGDGNLIEVAAPQRHAGAAATNAVLNFCPTPPFGYRGDVHKLHNDTRMPETELALARLSREEQQKLSNAYDAVYDKTSAKVLGEKKVYDRGGTVSDDEWEDVEDEDGEDGNVEDEHVEDEHMEDEHVEDENAEDDTLEDEDAYLDKRQVGL